MNALGELLTSTFKRLPLRSGLTKGVSTRMIILGIVGVFLILAGGLFDSAAVTPKAEVPAETAKNPPPVSRSYEEILEAKLANLLSQVKGAGAVSVCITLESGAEQEYAKNITRETKVIQERDGGGGVRTTTETKESDQVLLSRDSGADHPVMVRESKPQIKGVLVIAEGAQDSAVKANLTRAVEAGLGIPPYKITVLPHRR